MFEQSPKTLSLSGFLRLGITESSRTQGFEGLQSLLLLEDYINTSIHTYPGFARRININRRQLIRSTPYRGPQAYMYVGNPKRLRQLEIDKPIRLNSLMQAELLRVVILCVAHE